jgi:hypothetical protein
MPIEASIKEAPPRDFDVGKLVGNYARKEALVGRSARGWRAISLSLMGIILHLVG